MDDREKLLELPEAIAFFDEAMAIEPVSFVQAWSVIRAAIGSEEVVEELSAVWTAYNGWKRHARELQAALQELLDAPTAPNCVADAPRLFAAQGRARALLASGIEAPPKDIAALRARAAEQDSPHD